VSSVIFNQLLKANTIKCKKVYGGVKMPDDIVGDQRAYSLAGTLQEVAFISNVLNLPKRANILDLYCGYGRHAIELARKGYRVTGVDATEDFLLIARQKAAEENVDINFALCDMRDLVYNANFDAVINMFAAFGYYTDAENAEALQRVADALKIGGLFLIDLLNRDWIGRNNLNRYWRHPSGEYVLSYKIELKQGTATMKRVLLNQITGAKTQSEFVLRAYSLQEMAAMLENCGLKIVKTYGGFDGSRYGSEAQRMIILAQKQG
jgi:2-polyprenyl-3-methyl-5-hydroxy-6-metoxy-1,4-benzoquinol methylase